MAPLARPHTHLSNRAKVHTALERKPIFKSVLENPFQISWPSVPVNIQNILLARITAALENAPARARVCQDMSESPGRNSHVTEVIHSSAHLVIGINAVTRALEHQLRLTRTHIVVDNSSPNNDQLPLHPPSPIAAVFVCYGDVDPSALIDHVPYLVAGCNSSKNATQSIKLVPLPKGSEPSISQIIGLRRAAVVAFRRGSPLFETVQDLLDSVPIVSAPWLCPPDIQDTRLVPTHVKQLRTTAPKNMKGAREQRATARAAAKKNSARSIRRKPRMMLTTGLEDIR